MAEPGPATQTGVPVPDRKNRWREHEGWRAALGCQHRAMRAASPEVAKFGGRVYGCGWSAGPHGGGRRDLSVYGAAGAGGWRRAGERWRSAARHRTRSLVVMQDVFPPEAPVGLVAVPGPGSIDLSWEAGAEPGAESGTRPGRVQVAGYRVYRRDEAGGEWRRLNASSCAGACVPRHLRAARSAGTAIA